MNNIKESNKIMKNNETNKLLSKKRKVMREEFHKSVNQAFIALYGFKYQDRRKELKEKLDWYAKNAKEYYHKHELQNVLVGAFLQIYYSAVLAVEKEIHELRLNYLNIKQQQLWNKTSK